MNTRHKPLIYRMKYTSKNAFSTYALVIALSAMSLVACSTQKTATNVAEGSGVSGQNDKSELEKLYWDRINESKTSFVQADVDFMTGMIVHHSQALIMSRMVASNTQNTSIQILSSRIINAQNDEIATMQNWLRDRKQAVPIVRFEGLNILVDVEEAGVITSTIRQEVSTMRSERSADGTSHTTGTHSGGFGSHADMPGMLSLQQLEELSKLRGQAFDIEFLSCMIEHHTGAIYMVNQLLASDGAANDEDSYRLAVDIYAEQVTEIERMKLMIEEIATNKSNPK